jgi:hypothetical protein
MAHWNGNQAGSAAWALALASRNNNGRSFIGGKIKVGTAILGQGVMLINE